VPRKVLLDNAKALILHHDPASREVVLHPRLHFAGFRDPHHPVSYHRVARGALTVQALPRAKQSGGRYDLACHRARMAWHDRGWDGRVCHDPAANSYCTGSHSLLSERLAREKKRRCST
jgi:hypothetical protein